MGLTTRTDHNLRLKAFDLLQELKIKQVPRKEIIDLVYGSFGVPVGTLYEWYRNKYVPYGRRGSVVYRPEIFYVLGALLGDGCLYKWRITNHYLILVGDQKFTEKYATMLTLCIGRKAKSYINRSKGIWFVRCNNFELYSLFKKVREDLDCLERLIKQNKGNAALLFIEGFFDAEGCVKLIQEKTRKTAKICLDITNTDFRIVELVRHLLLEKLNIVARYSLQKADPSKNRKLVYHLRIYKKEYVKTFFENVKTKKLKPKHLNSVERWFAINP